MITAEQGLLRVLVISAVVCIAGLCALLLFAEQFFINCLAYGIATVVCMYLFSRYIISSVNHLHENNIISSESGYYMIGFFTGALSLLGFLKTITSGHVDGMMYMSFIMLGAELGEYRKIRLRKR